MIVPASRTRSVRIAPNSAAFRNACFSESGDLAPPELLGAVVYRIQKLLMRHPLTPERCCRTLVSLSQPTTDCHHSARPAVNLAERESAIFEWFER